MAKKEANGYLFEHQWFNFIWAQIENPDPNITVLPTHTALIFTLIHENNRFNWKESFPAPTQHIMSLATIQSYNTYKKIFNDLVSWGFVKVVKKSINGYKAKVITLSKFDIVDDTQEGEEPDNIDSHLSSTISNFDSVDDRLNDRVNNMAGDTDKNLLNLKTKKTYKNKKGREGATAPRALTGNNILEFKDFQCEKFKAKYAIKKGDGNPLYKVFRHMVSNVEHEDIQQGDFGSILIKPGVFADTFNINKNQLHASLSQMKQDNVIDSLSINNDDISVKLNFFK